MDAWPFPWAKPTAAAVFAAALAAGFTDAPSNPFRLLTAFTMTCFFAAGGGTIGGKFHLYLNEFVGMDPILVGAYAGGFVLRFFGRDAASPHSNLNAHTYHVDLFFPPRDHRIASLASASAEAARLDQPLLLHVPTNALEVRDIESGSAKVLLQTRSPAAGGPPPGLDVVPQDAADAQGYFGPQPPVW